MGVDCDIESYIKETAKILYLTSMINSHLFNLQPPLPPVLLVALLLSALLLRNPAAPFSVDSWLV
jgi:hypothetical protein